MQLCFATIPHFTFIHVRSSISSNMRHVASYEAHLEKLHFHRFKNLTNHQKKEQRFCADSFLFLCCSMFHGSVHAFWFLEMSATFLHPLTFPSSPWRQSVKRWIPSIFSFHCTRIFCEDRKFEESCSVSPTYLSTSSVSSL